MQRPPEIRAREYSLLVFSLALLVLVSPLRILWARDDSHWLLPFGIWFVVILLGAILGRGGAGRKRDEP